MKFKRGDKVINIDKNSLGFEKEFTVLAERVAKAGIVVDVKDNYNNPYTFYNYKFKIVGDDNSKPTKKKKHKPTKELTEQAQDDRDDFEDIENDGCTCHCGNPPCSWCTHPGNPHNQEDDFNYKPTKETSDMKKVISDVYEKTQDALLVERYFSSQIIDTFIGGLTVVTHKVAILKEAKRLEDEENKV